VDRKGRLLVLYSQALDEKPLKALEASSCAAGFAVFELEVKFEFDFGMQTDNSNLFVWSPNRLDSLNLLLPQFKIFLNKVPSRFFFDLAFTG